MNYACAIMGHDCVHRIFCSLHRLLHSHRSARSAPQSPQCPEPRPQLLDASHGDLLLDPSPQCPSTGAVPG